MSTRDTTPAGLSPRVRLSKHRPPTPHPCWCGRPGVSSLHGGATHQEVFVLRQTGRCIGATACSRKGEVQQSTAAVKRETFFFPQGTLRRGEKRKTQRRGTRTRVRRGKWPTLLHLYTPRHACSIYIYIMYIRMLYYLTTFYHHIATSSEREGGRGWGGSAKREKKKRPAT